MSIGVVVHMTKSNIDRFMALLEENDKIAWAHSVRMAVFAGTIPTNVQLDRKILQSACLVHDIGKIIIGCKVEERDGKTHVMYHNIKEHPFHSYALLRAQEPMLAKIALMHHLYQESPYPEKYPFIPVGNEMETLHRYALAVSCFDYIDAATYREGNKCTIEDIERVIRIKSKYEPEPGFVRELLSVMSKMIRIGTTVDNG